VVVRYGSDGDFWQRVGERYWQAAPFGFTVDAEAAPFSPDGVFAALSADVAPGPLDWIHVATRPEPVGVRDYAMVSFRRYGARASDGSLAGYLDRMAGTVFGSNVHDLGARNAQLRPVAELFRDRLGGAPDEPDVHTWEIDAFLGSYPITPLGIHQDNAAVFSFCLVGRRSYLLWPAGHFPTGHPDLMRPDPQVVARHAAAATRIDVAPGRGVFWPPRTWHVVLGDGEPFAVAQVSAYLTR
jgi:hypothetical protein